MKKNFKIHLFSSFLAAGLLCHTAFGQCPVTDSNNIQNLSVSSIATQTTASISNEVVTQEETANETRSGNANCSNSPSNEKTELSTKTYDYLKDNIVNMFESVYISPQEEFDDAVNMLKEKFFISKDDKESAKIKLQNRMAFAAEIAAESYALSQQLRPLYIEDLQSLHGASAKGCNQTQSNAMMNRNIKAQMKMLASQIIIQIVQMESDVVQQFIKESPTILELKPNDPSATAQGGSK